MWQIAPSLNPREAPSEEDFVRLVREKKERDRERKRGGKEA